LTLRAGAPALTELSQDNPKTAQSTKAGWFWVFRTKGFQRMIDVDQFNRQSPIGWLNDNETCVSN
jgi:hypothetical protein